VKDRGIGIDPKHIEKIFDRFFRANTKSYLDIPGFGIGLFITKEIVRLHGGKIWVDSKVGKGSTFYFSIPRR
jgi:signal transduction histidine kinase